MFTCEKEIFKCTSVILRTQAETKAWSAWLNIEGEDAISIYLWDSQLGDKGHCNWGPFFIVGQKHPINHCAYGNPTSLDFKELRKTDDELHNICKGIFLFSSQGGKYDKPIKTMLRIWHKWQIILMVQSKKQETTGGHKEIKILQM